jgi:hypothetical protein
VHHRPAGPSLTARLTGAFTRWALLLQALLRVRSGRLVLAGAVTTAVTAMVLVLPVVSGMGSEPRPMTLDSSSSSSASPSADEGSPVVMGVDGRPVASSSFAGAAPSTPVGETADVAPGTTVAPPATSEPAPDPAPTTAGATSAGAGSSTASSPRPPSAPAAPAPDPAEPPAHVPAEEPAEDPADDDAESDLLTLLNEARDDCAPLTTDGSLADAARAHSAAMRDAGRLMPLEGGPAGSIARGGTDADDVLSDWLDDPTGQATILDCSRGSVGIGLVDGGDGPWWTLLLA